jgi:hypothetical protein
LEPFTALRALVLYNNELFALDGDLFTNTPFLEYINLGRNQIRHLGPNIFNPVPMLESINLSDNLCFDENFDGNAANSTSIYDFVFRASFSCPSTFEQREILNGQNFQEIVNPLEARIVELERRIAAMKIEN